MRCNYTSRFACSPNGCNPFSPEALTESFLLVPGISALEAWAPSQENLSRLSDSELKSRTLESEKKTKQFALPEIRRCDSKGCGPVPILPKRTPTGLDLNSVKGTYFVALNTTNLNLFRVKRGEFFEVATMLNVALIGYGTCPLPEEDVSKDGGQ